MPRSVHSTLVLLGLPALLLALPLHAQVGAGGQFASAFSSLFGSPALSGEFQIMKEGGKTYLEFGAGFQARQGPDLKVFLSARDAGQVTGSNATEGALRLGLLKEFGGHQRYTVPSGTDLTKYRTVIVHCEKYAKLWGTGTLN